MTSSSPTFVAKFYLQAKDLGLSSLFQPYHSSPRQFPSQCLGFSLFGTWLFTHWISLELFSATINLGFSPPLLHQKLVANLPSATTFSSSRTTSWIPVTHELLLQPLHPPLTSLVTADTFSSHQEMPNA